MGNIIDKHIWFIYKDKMLSEHNTPAWVDNLSQLISARGISARALSLKAGLNATAVRDIIQHRSRSPRYSTIQALCQVLKVKPETLMQSDVEDNRSTILDTVLTSRQHEILELMAAGKSDAEIGVLLKISKHTVNAYLREIYRKFEANSRTLVVVKAIALGLLTIDNVEKISLPSQKHLMSS